MKIKVTREDIVQGEVKNGSRCPVARALKREFGENIFNDSPNGVHEEEVTINRKSYELSKRAREFIRMFDKKMSVRPFNFIIKGLKK